MRFGAVVVLGLSASLAQADVAQDKAKRRAEAEQYEKAAKTTDPDANYQRCGQAYLDAYNLDPTASDIDELLYNAGVCFEEARSIGTAVRMYELIAKHTPRSKVRPRALARLGSAYDKAGFLARAAEAYETYAKMYAAEKDAYQALSEAVVIRKALGDDDKAIEDSQRWIKTYGAKQPAVSAEVAYSLLAIYRKRGSAPYETYLRGFLREYGRADRRMLAGATLELAEVLWKRSCPALGVDGLCIRIERPRALPIASRRAVPTPATKRCGPTSTATIAVIPRDKTLVAEATKLFEQIDRLAMQVQPPAQGTFYQARAKFRLADRKLEAYAAVRFPTNLDFSPDRKSAKQASVKRFDEFVKTRMKLGGDARQAYEAVLASKDAITAIDAMQRLGMLSQSFATELLTAEIPKDVRTGDYAKDKVEAFCEKMTETAEPLLAQAITSYDVCLAKSTELGIRESSTRACAHERAMLGPTTYALTMEMVPDAPLPLPAIAEEPLRAGTFLPSALREAVEKFSVHAGTPAIPNDRCLPIAQRFEKLGGSTRSADAWFMAGLTYGRCARDTTAKAKAAYDAALAIDPKHGKSISNLGELAFRAGRHDEAKAQWEKAIALQPKLFAAQLGLATLGLRDYLKLPATAVNRKQLAAKIELHAQSAAAVGNSNSPLPYVQLGILAKHDGKPALATSFAQRAQKIEAGPYGYLLLAALTESPALHHLEAANAATRTLEEPKLALGLTQITLGRFEDAGRSLAQVRRPSYELSIARGIVARGQGQPADAEARYADASKLDPARPEAHFNLGVLYKDHVAARAGDPVAAKAAFKKAGDAFRRVNTPEAKQLADDCDQAAARL